VRDSSGAYARMKSLQEPALKPQRPDGLPKGEENVRGRVDGHLSTLRERDQGHHEWVRPVRTEYAQPVSR
jgi:hypothetical protein